MEPQILAAIFAALGAVFSGLVSVLGRKIGWRESAMRDITLFEKLYPYADGLDDDVTLEMLRLSIFSRVNRALSKSYRSYIGSLISFGLAYFSSLVLMKLLGMSFSVQATVFCAVGCAAGVAVSKGLKKVLQRWPRSERNGFYVAAQKQQKLDAVLKESRELLQSANLEVGWYGNYHAFREWWRKEKGYKEIKRELVKKEDMKSKPVQP